MVTCPKCNCGDCKKDGIVNGRQRHKCKSCGYRHAGQHVGKSAAVKRQALELYLEGLGFRSIGRCVLGYRGTATGKQLWGPVQDIEIGKVATDY